MTFGGRWRPCAIAVFGLLSGQVQAAEQPGFNKEILYEDMTPAEKTAAKRAAKEQKYEALRFCADPGNLPLSDRNGDGFQNRIAQAVAEQMGTRAVFFWRPYLERGLTRETFDNKECEILIEVPAGYGGVLSTIPIYRSAYVFAVRSDSGIVIDGLDDPDLGLRRVGVFQHSGIRDALRRHGVKEGLHLHVISHDADLRPEQQPWRQVQAVVDGELDVAAVWGPFAGWLVRRGAPLTLVPANLMDDEVALEFSLAFGVRKNDVVLKYALDDALKRAHDKIRGILVDYGVPLVACADCVVDGDLPSHGSFVKQAEQASQERFTGVKPRAKIELDLAAASADQVMTLERLQASLRKGADVDEEFANAILASDATRAAFLLELGADIDRRDKLGAPPLISAVKSRDVTMIAFLLDHGADVAVTDAAGWNAVQHAVLRNHVPSIELLATRGADIAAPAANGVTPLGLAVEEGMRWAASALIGAGAPPDGRFTENGLTPLMVLATQGEAQNRDLRVAGGPSVVEIAQALIDQGADANARSKAGITPLMIAAGHDNAAMIAFLMKAGADPAATDAEGRSALEIARRAKSDGAVKALRLFQAGN